MPRLHADYSKTIIYQICCLDTSITDIYIGQTTSFINRKYNHKTHCNNQNGPLYNKRLYKFIRENGGWVNWKMVQIEEYHCNNKREAEARETYWMKELKSSLNTTLSFQTQEEKKEYEKEYHKEYQQHSEKCKEYKKKYRQTKALYLKELKCYNLKLK
jgi:hypothetical protein